MVFQQFGGINGIGFYASQTFEEAGIQLQLCTSFHTVIPTNLTCKTYYISLMPNSSGISSKIGTIAYACVQVINQFILFCVEVHIFECYQFKVYSSCEIYLQVPITVVGAMLIDKSGRRPLIMVYIDPGFLKKNFFLVKIVEAFHDLFCFVMKVSATGTFLGCFLAGTSFFLKVHIFLT